MYILQCDRCSWARSNLLWTCFMLALAACTGRCTTSLPPVKTFHRQPSTATSITTFHSVVQYGVPLSRAPVALSYRRTSQRLSPPHLMCVHVMRQLCECRNATSPTIGGAWGRARCDSDPASSYIYTQLKYVLVVEGMDFGDGHNGQYMSVNEFQ